MQCLGVANKPPVASSGRYHRASQVAMTDTSRETVANWPNHVIVTIKSMQFERRREAGKKRGGFHSYVNICDSREEERGDKRGGADVTMVLSVCVCDFRMCFKIRKG